MTVNNKQRRELAFYTWIYFSDKHQRWLRYGYSDDSFSVDPPLEQIALLDAVRELHVLKDIEDVGSVMYVERSDKWLYFLRRVW